MPWRVSQFGMFSEKSSKCTLSVPRTRIGFPSKAFGVFARSQPGTSTGSAWHRPTWAHRSPATTTSGSNRFGIALGSDSHRTRKTLMSSPAHNFRTSSTGRKTRCLIVVIAPPLPGTRIFRYFLESGVPSIVRTWTERERESPSSRAIPISLAPPGQRPFLRQFDGGVCESGLVTAEPTAPSLLCRDDALFEHSPRSF